MGVRGFIMVKLKKALDMDALWELTRRFEAMDDIEFAASVIGEYDFVLTVDTKGSFEKVLGAVRQVETAGEVIGLKVNNIYDKHREIKDLKILGELSSPSTAMP